MKEIYINILEALANVPELKWVDLEKAQMNSGQRPAVAFPAALVTITLPRTENLVKTIQNVEAQITIRLCFDFTGSTNNKLTTTEMQKSLKYFDIADKVFSALQGFSKGNMNSLERINAVEEARPDGYKILAQTYRTSLHESVVK